MSIDNGPGDVMWSLYLWRQEVCVCICVCEFRYFSPSMGVGV